MLVRLKVISEKSHPLTPVQVREKGTQAMVVLPLVVGQALPLQADAPEVPPHNEEQAQRSLVEPQAWQVQPWQAPVA